MTLSEWERSLGRWSAMVEACQTHEQTGAQVLEQRAQTASASTATNPQAPPERANSACAAGDVQQNSMRTDWLDSIQQSAMACEFEVLLNHGQYPRGVELARDALRSVHVLEDELSVYRPASDLSNVNRWGHERPVAVRYDVCRLLALAQDISRATGRAFDITAGSLSEVWGFSRRQGRKPAEQELAAALQVVGSDLVTVDQVACTVRLTKPGIKLNPGGIGKGYALDCVANNLVDTGVMDFLIHGGRSSVAARGMRHDDEATGGWWIALAHPLRWEEKLGRIRLRNRALGTSGAGKQFFHYQGVRYSHVIDPRTGWPAQGVLSATAICRSGALADALATAFMIMGPEETRAFCIKHPDVSAILVGTRPESSRLIVDPINMPDGDWQVAREL